MSGNTSDICKGLGGKKAADTDNTNRGLMSKQKKEPKTPPNSPVLDHERELESMPALTSSIRQGYKTKRP